MRVVVAAHYASFALGGEALIPVQVFRQLRARGVEAWLVTHESARSELDAVLADDRDRLRYSRSVAGGDWLFRRGEHLPPAARAVAWSATQIERQVDLRREVRRLIGDVGADIVHQPISVSPSIPSLLRNLGVPVVMGPLNGGMNLPPAFSGRDTRIGRLRRRTRPILARVLDASLPARREAATLLVANERTRAQVPGVRKRPIRLVSDIGVDLASWGPAVRSTEAPSGRTRVVYVGRLVDWKAVDLLLTAIGSAVRRAPVGMDLHLRVIGDGPLRAELERRAAAEIPGHVDFTGWMDTARIHDELVDCDLLVLPSLAEAGGAVALEAMATSRPVVVADWGGPSTVVDDMCGVRVPVGSATGYVEGIADAVLGLAADPARRHRMGTAGRQRVEAYYDWGRITESLTAIYRDVLNSDQAPRDHRKLRSVKIDGKGA